MITGQVSSDLQAIIPLSLVDANGNQHDVQAVVDTGFNGFLTLPLSLISALGLKRRGSSRAVLADGSIDLFDLYAATVVWEGSLRIVEADAANAGILLGMSML